MWTSARISCGFYLLSLIFESLTQPALERTQMGFTLTVSQAWWISKPCIAPAHKISWTYKRQPAGYSAPHFILFSFTFIEEMKRGTFTQRGNIREPVGWEGVRVGSLLCKLCKQKDLEQAQVEWPPSFSFPYCGFKTYCCSAQDVPALHLAQSSPNMPMLGVNLFLQNLHCKSGPHDIKMPQKC